MTSVKNLHDWKAKLEEGLSELELRISKLESKLEMTNNNDLRITKLPSSLKLEKQKSFTTARKQGISDFRICAQIICKQRAGLLQCIWLFIFIASFVVLGVNQFLRVRWSLESDFKPAKKHRTIDYTDEENSMLYDEPYIYLYFECYKVDKIEANGTFWTRERVNETLEQLMQSQAYFNHSTFVHYMDDDFFIRYEHLPLVKAEAFYEEKYNVTENKPSFVAFFRLLLSNTKPSSAFELLIYLNINNLLSDKSIRINGFHVGVSRDKSKRIFQETVFMPIEEAIYDGSKLYYGIEYNERVTKTWNSEHVNLLSTNFVYSHIEKNWEQKDDWESGIVELRIRPNLQVEHWQEYVYYTYYDMVSDLGGIMNIGTTIFFWSAYYMALVLEEQSMGILPAMSFIFNNYEAISYLHLKDFQGEDV